jgi:hypothetical protein
VLPDTQHYSRADNGIFEAMTGWIAAARETHSIQAVVHVGDLVHDPTDEGQWAVARQAMGVLAEANIPAIIAPGNRDASELRDWPEYRRHFPVARYERMDTEYDSVVEWGAYDGTAENVYLLQEQNGERYLFVALEFGAPDGVLRWAKRVLARHSTATGIVVTHSYLYHDGSRVTATDPHAPTSYLDENVTTGQTMYDEYLSTQPSIAAICSGHHIGGPPVARSRGAVGDGSEAIQLFTNYQHQAGNGGDGWLRLLSFDPAGGHLTGHTYSPLRDAWNHPSSTPNGRREPAFTVSLDSVVPNG